MTRGHDSAPTHQTRTSFRRLTMMRVVLGIALIGLGTINVGCPSVAWDPHTESQITNDTDSVIEVGLVFDYGPDAPDLAAARQRMEELMFGEGFSLESVETASLMNSSNHAVSGTYSIQPSGFIVVHAGMGREPYFEFSEMWISAESIVEGFHDKDAIREVFTPLEDFRYELKVSDLLSEHHGPALASRPEAAVPTVVSWEKAKRIIKERNVDSVTQLHSLQVGIRLANGEGFTTTEPEIDAVIRWIETCDKRDSVGIITQ